MSIAANEILRKGCAKDLPNFQFGSGNLVPHVWYHKILRAGGKPDVIGITILSELLYLYRSEDKTEFQLGYDYFKYKFNCTFSQVHEALVRLEKQELVTRRFRSVTVYGRIFSNEMFLKLHVDSLAKVSQEHRNNDNQPNDNPSDNNL